MLVLAAITILLSSIIGAKGDIQVVLGITTHTNIPSDDIKNALSALHDNYGPDLVERPYLSPGDTDLLSVQSQFSDSQTVEEIIDIYSDLSLLYDDINLSAIDSVSSIILCGVQDNANECSDENKIGFGDDNMKDFLPYSPIQMKSDFDISNIISYRPPTIGSSTDTKITVYQYVYAVGNAEFEANNVGFAVRTAVYEAFLASKLYKYINVLTIASWEQLGWKPSISGYWFLVGAEYDDISGIYYNIGHPSSLNQMFENYYTVYSHEKEKLTMWIFGPHIVCYNELVCDQYLEYTTTTTTTTPTTTS